MVFSDGFTPTRVGWFLNAGQLVWTLKAADFVIPLRWPVACKLCAPGCADFGINTECEKFPAASAVAEAAVEASNARLTFSPAVNPEPETVTFVVGGPAAGEMETVAAKAKLALAATASIRTST